MLLAMALGNGGLLPKDSFCNFSRMILMPLEAFPVTTHMQSVFHTQIYPLEPCGLTRSDELDFAL